MREIHINKIHAKLGHPGEDRMRATTNHLHYSKKWGIEISKDCATVNIKQKLPRKVTEERDLKPEEMIYLEIISSKKPSYGGSKSWILIQDSDIKQKWSLFNNSKE